MIRIYYHKLALLIASTSLIVAYLSEYIFDFTPCPLCIYQRFPYLVLFALSIFGICSFADSDPNNNNLNQQPTKDTRIFLYYLLIYAFSIIISFYHSGVERGFFEMSSICNSASDLRSSLLSSEISIENFHKLLENQVVTSCEKPAIIVLSLSMAEWNLLLNLGLFVLTLFLIVKRIFESRI